MDARPPRSLACSSARAPPCMRSYPASLGKGAPPSTTAGRAARDGCSGRRRTSASRSCSKRTLPSNMAGCARQLRWSCKLLDKLRRTYRCHKELHLATDNDSSHLSKRVELVWWSLHEAVSRNHECAGLDDLVEFAEGYLEERQPFGPKLGEVYDRRERPPPRGRASVHLSRGVI